MERRLCDNKRKTNFLKGSIENITSTPSLFKKGNKQTFCLKIKLKYKLSKDPIKKKKIVKLPQQSNRRPKISKIILRGHNEYRHVVSEKGGIPMKFSKRKTHQNSLN